MTIPLLEEVYCRCGRLLAYNLEGRVEIVCPDCRRRNTPDSRRPHLTGQRHAAILKQAKD